MTQSIIPPNRLRERLSLGQLAIGTMLVELRQPSVMTMLANAGFDFVLIDNEHGPFSVETIADLSRGARDAGVTPIVRIPELTYAHVAQALEPPGEFFSSYRELKPFIRTDGLLARFIR